MTTIAEIQQMPRTERAHRLAFIRILAHLGPVACFPAEEVQWLLKEFDDQAAEIEQLQARLNRIYEATMDNPEKLTIGDVAEIATPEGFRWPSGNLATPEERAARDAAVNAEFVCMHGHSVTAAGLLKIRALQRAAPK